MPPTGLLNRQLKRSVTLRLTGRLVDQMAVVTMEVVGAARESLVIGVV